MRTALSAVALASAGVSSIAPASAQDAAATSHGDHVRSDHSSMDHSPTGRAGVDQQDMSHDQINHGGMTHPAAPAKENEQAEEAKPAQQADHSMHGDHSMHAGHGMAPLLAADDTPGNAAPPPVPTDLAAARFYPRAVIEGSLAATLREMTFRGYALQLDHLEYRARNGADGYGFGGQGWYGGDIDRAVLAFEGEGSFGENPERLELSGYWRHALDPWFNLQLGVRHDFHPGPQRTYAMIGIKGLAPYWLEGQAQLFVSEKGDAHTRLTASYDQRITNRLIFEPELEADIAFQDVRELGIGSGFDKLELSGRLRYEFSGMFAPYVGVFWDRKFGGSARYARARGEDASAVSAVAGVRMIF